MKTSMLAILALIVMIISATFATDSAGAAGQPQLTKPSNALPFEFRRAGERGGIYIDDALLTNNGQTIFFDDFQSDNLKAWMDAPIGAKVECSEMGTDACCVHLGRPSELFRKIDIPHPGVVEYSAWVWLPPTDEQSKATFTSIYLYGGQENVSAAVQVEESANAYRIDLRWNKSGGHAAEVSSKTAVLKSGKWARLMLRLDYKNKQASALLENAKVAAMPFSSKEMSTLNKASFWGWLGSEKPSK